MPYLSREHLPDGWSVKEPLYLRVHWDGSYYLAGDNTLFMYGVGDTVRSALLDYGLSLVETYELFEQDLVNDPGEMWAKEQMDKVSRFIIRGH